jgi:peptide/nickel transport system substrate-binding protein
MPSLGAGAPSLPRCGVRGLGWVTIRAGARDRSGGNRLRIVSRAGTAALAVASALVVLVGPAGAQSATPSSEPTVTFTVGVTGDLNSANPFRQLDTTESFVGGLMYDGLLRRNQQDFSPEGELADRWDVSDDGLTWTFHLRDGLEWSDGVPLTAQDFAWTGNFIVDNDISSWSDGYRFTDSITASDAQTIVWKTKRPTLIPGLPGYNLILPEHVWGEFTVKELKSFKNFPDPVISGSYNLVEWNQGEYWTMDANPDYWQGAPNVDRYVFRVYNSNESVVQALLKGAIDYSTVPTAALFAAVEDQPGIGSTVVGADTFYQMSFNLADDPSSTADPAVLDPAFRQAVAWAIDKQTLVDRVTRGYATPGVGPVVPLYGWNWEPPADEAVGFDLAKANDMLDAAGYEDTDGDGIRENPGGGDDIELRLYTASTDPDGVKAAPFIAGWLKDIGIDSSLRSMTDSKLYDLWYGFDWDLIIYSWGVGADPDFILSSFTTNQCGFWSDTCYANPQYDTLYKQQQTTLDADRRAEIVDEMQQMIYRDVPEIVLWYANWFEAWRSDRWTGFVPWPEPDGTMFWGNYYSARSVRPVSDTAVAPQPESGPPAWIWFAGMGVIGAGLILAVARRRRHDSFYG